MEENKIVEGNILISEFRHPSRLDEKGNRYYFNENYPQLGPMLDAKDLSYHKSWDWLMKPVNQIHFLFKAAFPTNERFIEMILAKEDPIDKEYMNVLALPVCTPIDEVWEEVVAFIHWHTTNKH